MSTRKANIVRFGLDALHRTRVHKLMAPYVSGVGAIFMLHQVTPEPRHAFDPNAILRVTPEFLEASIEEVRRLNFDVVSLDEAHKRLTEGDYERPFVCFTLDDGYRDNRDVAFPIFKAHDVPFTVYVPSDFAAGTGELWWLAFEQVIRSVDQIALKMNGVAKTFRTVSATEKTEAFNEIYWYLRGRPEDEFRTIVREACAAAGIDLNAFCRNLIMDWDELRAFNRDPLVTIGGHTRRHYAVAKLPLADAVSEIKTGMDHLEAELGERPQHFSYPYGDETSAGPRDFRILKEMGVKTAVTTRKGLVHAEHVDHLTALPRVSLNGDYQDPRFVGLYLSGAPFALFNRFRKVNVD